MYVFFRTLATRVRLDFFIHQAKNKAVYVFSCQLGRSIIHIFTSCVNHIHSVFLCEYFFWIICFQKSENQNIQELFLRKTKRCNFYLQVKKGTRVLYIDSTGTSIDSYPPSSFYILLDMYSWVLPMQSEC